METITLQIDGMHCGSCVSAIERALRGVNGVESVAVALDPGNATVQFDPQRSDRGALVHAVTAAGYAVGGAVADAPASAGHCAGGSKGKTGCCCG